MAESLDGQSVFFSLEGKLRVARNFYQELFRERGGQQEEVESYLEGLEKTMGGCDSVALGAEVTLAEAEAAMALLKSNDEGRERWWKGRNSVTWANAMFVAKQVQLVLLQSVHKAHLLAYFWLAVALRSKCGLSATRSWSLDRP